jgi:hypothetical protein
LKQLERIRPSIELVFGRVFLPTGRHHEILGNDSSSFQTKFNSILFLKIGFDVDLLRYRFDLPDHCLPDG